MIKLVKCNLCGSSRYSVLYKTYSGDAAAEERDYRITDHRVGVPLRIVKCGRCGLIYANPRPAVRSLISAYNRMVDEAYVEEEAGRRASARLILKMLGKYKKRGRLLDVGCATGFLLDEARKAGWEIHGVELSDWAAGYAKDILKVNTVFHGILKNARYPDGYFDAVVMQDSIEHLTDPRGTLLEVRRVLKPSGIICVNTPDIDSFISRVLKARWWGVKQSHLYYFNRRTLHAMLWAAGYAPFKTKSHVRVFTLKYWVAKLKGYNGWLHSISIFLIRLGIIKDGLLRVNMGDQIEVYAVKVRKFKYPV